jgi:molybdopterin converting factor small subunit
MEITIELYGGLQRLAGVPELTLRLPREAGTVADALDELVRSAPALAGPLRLAAVAVGDTLARRTDPVAAGARIALLPPVAGG